MLCLNEFYKKCEFQTFVLKHVLMDKSLYERCKRNLVLYLTETYLKIQHFIIHILKQNFMPHSKMSKVNK